MSFAPVIPIGGYGGWKFLQRTLPAQKAAFEAVSTTQRDEAYFREKIGSVKTADDLVSDRRLLQVALGAFGLDADINNKAFIRKVLEGGTLQAGSLANRLADKQYQKLSATFGFGDFAIPSTQLSDFADKILTQYRARSFEVAVGEQNGDLRLALNAERDLPAVARAGSSDDARWFTIMGTPPLRTVFEKAFGLPASFGALDVDTQLATLKDKATAMFGDPSAAQFTDADKTQQLIRQFLLRSEAAGIGAGQSRAAGALELLQQGQASLRALRG